MSHPSAPDGASAQTPHDAEPTSPAGGPGVRWNPLTSAAFGRYRVMAFVTGSFLLLLCVEMLLKYVLQVNGPDQAVLGDWIAIIHGWIYVVYAVTCLQVWSKARWGLGRLAAMIAGGVVPVMSFIVEARAARWPVGRTGRPVEHAADRSRH
ncbi:DUF3817 domain-containing protein [Serinibacter salmoneus]|uniref:Integral membrane protein n=1 Tax=Serinibacter salmoneus TaxID=556530 RepID=A0A2A9CX48_9MICO|nr:DUF3817 domain-containing protein [Serinibacter salmoneus]PFG19004.1 integral membrane protein [Serinibacter salmoneus]